MLGALARRAKFGPKRVSTPPPATPDAGTGDRLIDVVRVEGLKTRFFLAISARRMLTRSPSIIRPFSWATASRASVSVRNLAKPRMCDGFELNLLVKHLSNGLFVRSYSVALAGLLDCVAVLAAVVVLAMAVEVDVVAEVVGTLRLHPSNPFAKANML